MKIIIFILNFIISLIFLYKTPPTFTTYEALPENHQGQIYITVDYGISLDDSGNGMLYGYDTENNYISYSKVKNAKTGNKIYTFCILNPNSNDYDDIIYRVDIIEGWGIITIN